MPETTPHDQTEPYFEIHRNYPDRYRCRRARRHGVPATLLAAWYPVMHDLASNAGTFGEFTTDVRAFEEAVGEPERFGTSAEDCQRDEFLASIWRKLELAKVCKIIDGEPESADDLAGIPNEFRVRVLGMASRPRRKAMSDAERQAAKRARDKADASVTPSRNVTNGRDTSRDPVMSRGSIHPSIHPSIPEEGCAPEPASALAHVREGGPGSPTTTLGMQSIEEIREHLGDALPHAITFVEAARAERPRGMTDDEVRAQLWTPLAARISNVGVSALTYGLSEANRQHRPGLAYVDSCIETFRTRGAQRGPGEGPSEASRNAAILADLDRRHGKVVAEVFDLADARDRSSGVA